MRVTLIHNPSAGRRMMTPAGLRKMLEQHGHEVRYQSSKEKGWKKALRKPAELVVVAGGDGTVGRVARRMVGRRVPIALLPSGTANNIARTLGQLERPFEELVRGWENARRIRLDVAVAAGPWGERYFIEGLGAGIFARMLSTPGTKKLKKRRGGVERGLRRLAQEAARAEPVEVAAILDGKDISGRYLMLEALNLRDVRVPVDDRVAVLEARRQARLAPQPGPGIVNHPDPHAAHLDDVLLRKPLFQCRLVHVPVHALERRP